MATKKADLESYRNQYYARVAQAEVAVAKGMYRAALDAAMSAWEYVDSMMQYEGRFEHKGATSVAAINMVLIYAPLLLDNASLNQLEKLLTDFKRIARNNSDDLRGELAKARETVWDCHRLWIYLEANPEVRQCDLRKFIGGQRDSWQSVTDAWETMGLIRRTPDGNSSRLSLRTRMGQVVPAKCPNCGTVTEAPKAMLLTENPCLKCRKPVLFVFLAATAVEGSGGKL
ncbi:MAG: hypothetical protein ACYCUV_09010 [Phycisphaerae bacterium]